MFDQMKAFGALAGLLRDKDRVREIGERFQERLDRIRVEGTGGGGAVRVTVTGRMRVDDVTLDPALIAGLETGEGGREMAQALILEAVNDGLARAQAMIQDEARRMSEELGLPDMPGMERLLGAG